MTPFYVLGGVLAAWALIVTAIGLMRHDFPGSKATERVVSAISVVLVAGAIGSGIITAANQDHGGEHAEAAEATAEGAGDQGDGVQDPAGDEARDLDEPLSGEDRPAGGGEPAAALTIAADPDGDLAFDTEQLEAHPGEITITMRNPSSVPHNVALEGPGVQAEGEVVGEGQTSHVTAELPPGEYTFYCSVAGHREAGMEGTLTVAEEG